LWFITLGVLLCTNCSTFCPKTSGQNKRQLTYNFNAEWEESYCFFDITGTCIYFLCGSSVAVPKKHNVERHFKANQSSFVANYPFKSELRKKKKQELKSKLLDQQSIFTTPAVKCKYAAIPSLKIAHLLAKKEKTFQDGELLKETFLTGADCFFEGFSNKREIMSAIHDLQLSDNTVTRRIQVISSGMKSDLELCDRFSLQFDKSTDISDTAQLAIMVRIVFSGLTVKEALCLLRSKQKVRYL
jgi:hypothetical protein